jgi:pimeloyl-ACP methyl ester carboxylesterase
MHWASNHEVRDLDAAIAHVRSRVGDDNAWIGLLGVSRGGSTAILVAASDPGVRAVVTDGAFPTNLTQLAYMLRWAKIYIGEGLLYRLTPDWYYSLLCGIARNLAARRHGCRFPRVAKAIRKISPRPLLIIHGEKDSYIVPEIADQLFKRAGEPKEFWLVPGAKHNAAIQVASESYGRRLVEFFNAAH